VVLSLGAGVHEELVFRLGLMGGGTAALLLAGLGRGPSVAIALVVSAVLFSAAHHAGPLGEPFDRGVFVYRALAGVVFGLVFYFRSLAHAVYTHFLYDVWVLILRSWAAALTS
jgi:membrane protease YdiL (CAAX protease family)